MSALPVEEAGPGALQHAPVHLPLAGAGRGAGRGGPRGRGGRLHTLPAAAAAAAVARHEAAPHQLPQLALGAGDPLGGSGHSRPCCCCG